MKYIIVACSILLGLTCTPVYAADTTTAVPSLSSYAGCTGTDCSACNLVDLANGLIVWLIGFLFIIFAVLLAYAGFGLLTSGGSHHALDEAKSKFTNAIVGMLIILSAWLVVDTIMRGLVGHPDKDGEHAGQVQYVTGWLYWTTVQCQTQTVPDDFKAWVDQIATALEGVDSWVTGSNGAKTSPCTVTGGFSGIPISYDCSVQIAQCEQQAGGTASLSGDKQSVSCIPDADAIVPVSGGGASCPAAPESSMVPIPGTAYKALPQIANNFVKMRDAARADGITLDVSSGYRSEAQQVSIWVGKGCDVDPSKCTKKAARPCTYGGNGSNHSQGLAVDISMPKSTTNPIFVWLKTNGGRYGFFNELGAPDPYHWSPSGR
jgi:D-alanyl-D-alanine carboxypeptidase/Type IV secretion system pilin